MSNNNKKTPAQRHLQSALSALSHYYLMPCPPICSTRSNQLDRSDSNGDVACSLNAVLFGGTTSGQNCRLFFRCSSVRRYTSGQNCRLFFRCSSVRRYHFRVSPSSAGSKVLRKLLGVNIFENTTITTTTGLIVNMFAG